MSTFVRFFQKDNVISFSKSKEMQKTQNPSLTQIIIEALQDKKGRDIVDVNLSGIAGAVCDHLLLCTANSPSQVCALADNVEEQMRELLGEKPLSVTGATYAHWVAMDCDDVFVHILLDEERAFYDIEHLWADAPLTQIPNLD